jgi:hypothetical protein
LIHSSREKGFKKIKITDILGICVQYLTLPLT